MPMSSHIEIERPYRANCDGLEVVDTILRALLATTIVTVRLVGAIIEDSVRR